MELFHPYKWPKITVFFHPEISGVLLGPYLKLIFLLLLVKDWGKICVAGENDEQFNEMVEDPNSKWKERFWDFGTFFFLAKIYRGIFPPKWMVKISWKTL